jgi:hypothetical protein
MFRSLVVATGIALSITGCAAQAQNGSVVVAPTGPFKATNANVASTVTKAIDGGNSSPGLASAPQVKCIHESAGESISGHSGINCNIVYTVKEPAGISPDMELIAPTAGFWRVLFSDPSFQGAYVEVKGPTTNEGGQSSVVTMFSLACERNAASHIDWSNVEGSGLRKLCTYTPSVGGLPSSESSG